VLIASLGQHRAFQSLWLFENPESGVSGTSLGSIQYLSDIGEILIEQGLLTEQQVKQLCAEASQKDTNLATLLKYKTAMGNSR